MKISPIRKFASYFVPLKMWKGSGTHNPVLELFLYKGNWQLATEDAIYSDGKRYKPLLAAFKKIKKELPEIKNMLALGSGIGSAVQILRSMNFYPQCHLVDHDEKILQLARCLLKDESIQYLHISAEKFVQEIETVFDLVVIDIFTGRQVPAFVSSENFIQKCRKAVAPGGILIINYILNNKEDSKNFALLKQMFPVCETLHLGINKVLITKA